MMIIAAANVKLERADSTRRNEFVKNIPMKEIIQLFENPDLGCFYTKDEKAFMRETVIRALNEKEERDNPKPLTHTDLMLRDGKRVYLHNPDCQVIRYRSRWLTVKTLGLFNVIFEDGTDVILHCHIAEHGGTLYDYQPRDK